MSIIDRFLKKREGVEPAPAFEEPSSELPEDLEQFRIQRRMEQLPPREFTTARFPERAEPQKPETQARDYDKLDMIIQKLETIDARLKLLEERLSR